LCLLMLHLFRMALSAPLQRGTSFDSTPAWVLRLTLST